MVDLQTFEGLWKEIAIQQNRYREASDNDERFEVKKIILVKLRELEKQLSKLKETIERSPD
jgi:hypothetical protein